MRRREVLRLGSVRARTTLAATAVVALTLAVASWVLLVTLEQGLVRSQDDAARGRARDLAALVADDGLPRSVSGIGDDSVVQVVDAGGQVLSATPNLAGRPPVATFAPSGVDPEVRTVGVHDGREVEDYRLWAVRGSTPTGLVTVYVGSSLEAVAEAVSRLSELLVVGVPVVAALIGLVTWVVVGRALAPVGSIRAQVSDISDAELHRRVPEPATGDEIAQLARTMNAMLGRLESASRRQRAFVADASHELQSPLTRFRTQLEVALANRSTTDWEALASDLLEDGAEMERLVRDLLFLARDEERPSSARPDDMVDLDHVVLDEVARVCSAARVVVDASRVSAAPVRGSRDELVRLVRNLLENAERHASTRVDVSLSDGAVVELVVRDDGPGIPVGERRRIFDRFVRLDDARARDSGGSGLGLAIVDTVARRHGGAVEVRDEGGGATFVVRLPPAVSPS